jgi:hypothetical protein
MFTTHGHWFPPAVPGEQMPATIIQCGGPGGCQHCAEDCRSSPVQTGALMPAVLSSPTPAAPSSPSGSAKPLAVPIDGVKDWYLRYLELKTAAKQIEDLLDEARSTLLDAVKSRFADLPAKTDFTIDGKPVLQRQVVIQKRVDTKRLKAERPDVHAQFVRDVEQERLNIL